MNRNPLPAILLLCLLVVGAIAVATTVTAQADENPALSPCEKRELLALQAAVDPQQAENQEWNLRAAEAYRLLNDIDPTAC